MSNSLPTGGFKWTDPEEFELRKYSSNSLNGCVVQVALENPEELCQLHNDYLLTPDKTRIKFKNQESRIN